MSYYEINMHKWCFVNQNNLAVLVPVFADYKEGYNLYRKINMFAYCSFIISNRLKPMMFIL